MVACRGCPCMCNSWYLEGNEEGLMNNKQSRLFPVVFSFLCVSLLGHTFNASAALCSSLYHESSCPCFLPICQLPKIPSWDVAHGVNMLITATSRRALIHKALRWTRALTVSAVHNFLEAVTQKLQFPSRLRAVTSLTARALILWSWLMLTCYGASSSCLGLPCLLTPPHSALLSACSSVSSLRPPLSLQTEKKR